MKYCSPKIITFSFDDIKSIVALASSANLCTDGTFACRNKDENCRDWEAGNCKYYDNIDSIGGVLGRI